MNLALLSNQETTGGTKAIDFVIKSLNLTGSSAAFIASQPDNKRYFFSQAQDVYKSVGIGLGIYIDFESGFSESLLAKVLSKSIVHLSGGNTYRFLHSLKSRGVVDKLVNFNNNGGVFIGVSAGAMLLTPSIESTALCGDVNGIGLNDYKSLGLVDFLFLPHATKQQNELEAANQLVAKHNQVMYLCNDDDGVVIVNNQVHLFGKPVVLSPVEHSA